MVPSTEMERDLKGQEKDLSDDINNLNKKVHLITPNRSKLILTYML